MERAFSNAVELHEAESFVERHRVRFGVGDDADTAERVALLDREGKDVTEQRLAYAETLGAQIDTESRESQYRQWIAGQPSP